MKVTASRSIPGGSVLRRVTRRPMKLSSRSAFMKSVYLNGWMAIIALIRSLSASPPGSPNAYVDEAAPMQMLSRPIEASL